MRQLKISRQHTDPVREAENANAIPFLQKLAAVRPLGLESFYEDQLLRFIVSLAKQYWGQGVPLESLLAAGYEAVVKSVELDGSRPGEGSRYLSWRVRQAIVMVSLKNQVEIR